MSKETIADLNVNTLIGYTDKRGNAWHYRAEEQGAESNHYVGAIPVEDVRRRLFSWLAVSAPLTYTLPDGRVFTDPERQVIARGDTGDAMGVFKSGYKIHQYDEWLVKNVETLLDADIAVGSAGLLSRGAVAWVQVEMADTLSVDGYDYRPFLTAATSCNGTLASTYQTGVQAVVCDNTLSAALGEKTSRVKVRHSKNSLDKYQDVRDALSIVHTVGDDFAKQVAELNKQVVTDKQWASFLDQFTGLDKELEAGHALTLAENKRDTLAALWNADPRVSPWKGTAFGVVQAVNTYTHHEGIVRGATRSERNAERVITGKVDALDQSTLALLAKVTA